MGHDTVEAPFDGWSLVLLKSGGYLGELPGDGLSAEPASAGAAPLPKEAGGGLQLIHFAHTQTAGAARSLIGVGWCAPAVEGVEKWCAGDGGASNGTRRGSAVHHEIAPGQIGSHTSGGVWPPRYDVGTWLPCVGTGRPLFVQ
ncbi:hypothetical protein Z951_19270 [Streptomyces sp. PRh5]|nr:hypothetical protein Z951_19270 [Streptomyces sp. PRh5]